MEDENEIIPRPAEEVLAVPIPEIDDDYRRLIGTVLGPRRARMVDMVCEKYPSARSLALASPHALLRAGLTDTAVSRLGAVLALGDKIRERRVEGKKLKASADIFAAFHDRLRRLTREHFIAVDLDAKNAVIRERVVSVGILTASLVHPREVFTPALEVTAGGVILIHNHPSGDPEPSPEDHEVTRRLSAVGELLGMRILDHVVIGDGRYVSFLERGLIE